MKRQQEQQKGVGYLGISTMLEDDSDDGILDPRSTLMHSDLATIAESSTLNTSDDDLTLSESVVSSLGSRSVNIPSNNKKKYTAKKYSDLITSQVITEGENESQSSSALSSRLDKMESQLAKLQNQQQQFEIQQEPLDELDPSPEEPTTGQYHDFSNVVSSFLLNNERYNRRDDYDFDDSSTITSMPSMFKPSRQVVLYQSSLDVNVVPEIEEEEQERQLDPPEEAKQELVHDVIQDDLEANNVYRDEIKQQKEEKELIVQEQRASLLFPQNENLKENIKKEQSLDVTPSVARTVPYISNVDDDEYTAEYTADMTITKSMKQQRTTAVDNSEENLKRAKKKKTCFRYTLLLVLFTIVIVLSNVLTGIITKNNSSSTSNNNNISPLTNNDVIVENDEVVVQSTIMNNNTTITNSSTVSAAVDAREREDF